MQSSPREKKRNKKKKFEIQKVKIYIFPTKYISLKCKNKTNEHEQKHK